MLTPNPTFSFFKVAPGRLLTKRFSHCICRLESFRLRPGFCGNVAIDPVSHRRCSYRRIHEVLIPNRFAICSRVPSRALHAATIRSRRSIEYGLMP